VCPRVKLKQEPDLEAEIEHPHSFENKAQRGDEPRNRRVVDGDRQELCVYQQDQRLVRSYLPQ
jgi:hypothetical protein